MPVLSCLFIFGIKKMNKLRMLLDQNKFILTEGAVIERLKREYNIPIDPLLLNSTIIYNSEYKNILADIYCQYIDIAKEFNLPIMLLTPTWRANYERLRICNYSDKQVNSDNVKFMINLINSYGNFADKVALGGLVGPKNDAYKPDEALTTSEAEKFHYYQIKELVNNNLDFLQASTLPAISEAKGIAKVMSETNVPYIISFVANNNACLLDGTSINKAIDIIDNYVSNKPIFYSLSCTHPYNAKIGFINDCFINSRLKGIQGNASKLTHKELDNALNIDSQDAVGFANDTIELSKLYNLQVLGGCCGTNAEHIKEIAKQIK